jgi:thiol-disulfide isomerase/thioredoxin
MQDSAPKRASTVKRTRLLAVALAGAALALAVSLYLFNAGQPAATECPAQPAAAKAIDAAAVGELAAMNGTGQGRGYREMAFADGDGKPLTISSFAGKKLLVNFWASWCVPCREEMPALDTLAAKYNGPDFQVLPVNLDVGEDGLKKARAFLAEGKWAHLPLYADNTMAAFDKLKTAGVTLGLPATLLLDAKGCELAALQGPAKWDSPDGENVIKALLGV